MSPPATSWTWTSTSRIPRSSLRSSRFASIRTTGSPATPTTRATTSSRWNNGWVKNPARAYDRLARQYDRRWRRYLEETLGWMAGRVGPDAVGLVLDVGCG